MKASETTLRKLIGGEIQFVIPLYQRPYSWTTAELDRLWSDVLTLADALTEDDGRTHFIGSVVMAPSPLLTPAHAQWVVVDGQQRLTTLLLALCAIRDHVAAEDPLRRDRLNELHLINRFAEDDFRYRLLPTQVDRQPFKACLDGTVEHLAAAPGPDKVSAAYRFFRSRLVSSDDPADPHDIQRIESAVLDRLSFVHITVERDDNAFRIFESINNTGMRLNQVDLIRNHIFMCLPNRMQHVYNLYWRPMQERLSRRPFTSKTLDQLMYLALVLRRGVEAKVADTYGGHRELLAELDGEEEIEEYVADLARRSRHLEMILDPSTAPSVIRERLRFLNEWEATTAYPVIMRLLDLHEDGDTNADEQQIKQALSYIESFYVLRMIGGVSSRALTRIFQRLAVQLTRDEPVADTIRQALSAERQYWLTDDQLRDHIRTSAFYWRGSGPQRKLVLRRLAEHYRPAERVILDDPKITIEHVLPQNLTQSWRAELSADGDPGELHPQLVHTLGNLTLTGYNPELGDMPFKEKREKLIKTSITMNHAIAEKEQWGRGEIISRADDLAERAISLWPGPVRTSAETTSDGADWTLLHEALAILPAGSWTTYGDLADLVGSAPLPVGVHLANVRVPNAHRALTASAQPSVSFRWPDPDDKRDVVDVLRAEGVTFAATGRADPGQRMTSLELATLLGMPGAQFSGDVPDEAVDPAALDEYQRRFHDQLSDRNNPATAGAVTRLQDHWKTQGGEVEFGSARTGRCSLTMKHDGRLYWLLNIFPTSIEVSFRSLCLRPPFDDPAVRDEIRTRLNTAPRITIPAAKLELLPKFDCAVLADPGAYDIVVATLDWFAATTRAHTTDSNSPPT